MASSCSGAVLLRVCLPGFPVEGNLAPAIKRFFRRPPLVAFILRHRLGSVSCAVRGSRAASRRKIRAGITNVYRTFTLLNTGNEMLQS